MHLKPYDIHLSYRIYLIATRLRCKRNASAKPRQSLPRIVCLIPALQHPLNRFFLDDDAQAKADAAAKKQRIAAMKEKHREEEEDGYLGSGK